MTERKPLLVSVRMGRLWIVYEESRCKRTAMNRETGRRPSRNSLSVSCIPHSESQARHCQTNHPPEPHLRLWYIPRRRPRLSIRTSQRVLAAAATPNMGHPLSLRGSSSKSFHVRTSLSIIYLSFPA